jgi:23S rRNA pseudouridine1911/1915/1917 synthase
MSDDAASTDPRRTLLSQPLDVLLEDGPLLAVNKPAGLLTQGVPDGLPSLEALVKAHLKDKYRKPGNVYLGMPHRLDRPVSGVVVMARNSKAAARLAEQFRHRTVRKWYLCLTERRPEPAAGVLEDWLLKDAEAAQARVVAADTPGAQSAVLHYRALAMYGQRALVQVELLTGRMHQIRVQLSSRGWPIVGDRQYGATSDFAPSPTSDARDRPIALHAAALRLKHPIRYDELTIRAPLSAAWPGAGCPFDASGWEFDGPAG